MFKLLKHDIKDNYLEIVVLNGMLIGATILGILSVKAEATFLAAIIIGIWAICLSAALFVVINSIIKSFHKKFFTDQGYLTLTTPVSVDKILLSKIIVNMLWIITTIIVTIICLLIVVSSLITVPLLSEVLILFKQNPLEVFKLTVSGLTSALYLITMLILVLVLVNTGIMKKHKLIKGILIYIAISVLVSITNPLQSNFLAPTTGEKGEYLINLAVNLFWSVVFYFVSRYLIIHKLELE